MKNRILILLLALFAPALSVPGETDADPESRYIMIMRAQGQVFAEAHPETFNRGNMLEVAEHFPPYSPDNEINVGVGGMFSYFRYDIEVVEESLRRFLALSEELDVPIWIRLDGEHWLDARPDLWNWWDPEMPGYDPANARNVEWTHWGPEHAIKVSWRNWGRQIRVRPAINLMSPEYRAANEEALERIIPIIADWYEALPEDRKGLFAGISGGGETAVGVNSYYYPNGNDVLGEPESADPFRLLVLEDTLSRGVQQIGYAAVSGAGIREEGDIEEEDLVEVCRRHVEWTARKMHEMGLPRDRIYSHTFGNKHGEALFDAAVNEYSVPGWSSYWHTTDILEDPGVVRNIARPDVPHWGSVEWLLLFPTDRTELWKRAVSNTINAPGLKLMCILNWEGIDGPESTVPEAINAVIDAGLQPRELPGGPRDVRDKSLYEIE